MEVLGLTSLPHEDLSNHYCVDWLKAHEAHISRDKTLEIADLTEIPEKSIIGSVNYRPLKELVSPGLIVEPPKHRTSFVRIPDTAYMGPKLSEIPRYGKSYGTSELAKTPAVYDRSDPGAARVIIVAGSDFDGTSPKLLWPETLVYLLPGAELNRMLTLIVAMKS